MGEGPADETCPSGPVAAGTHHAPGPAPLGGRAQPPGSAMTPHLWNPPPFGSSRRARTWQDPGWCSGWTEVNPADAPGPAGRSPAAPGAQLSPRTPSPELSGSLAAQRPLVGGLGLPGPSLTPCHRPGCLGRGCGAAVQARSLPLRVLSCRAALPTQLTPGRPGEGASGVESSRRQWAAELHTHRGSAHCRVSDPPAAGPSLQPSWWEMGWPRPPPSSPSPRWREGMGA